MKIKIISIKFIAISQQRRVNKVPVTRVGSPIQQLVTGDDVDVQRKAVVDPGFYFMGEWVENHWSFDDLIISYLFLSIFWPYTFLLNFGKKKQCVQSEWKNFRKFGVLAIKHHRSAAVRGGGRRVCPLDPLVFIMCSESGFPPPPPGEQTSHHGTATNYWLIDGWLHTAWTQS